MFFDGFAGFESLTPKLWENINLKVDGMRENCWDVQLNF